MHLSPKAVHRILKDKGVSHLYHANSVLTSATFLRTGKLISRGSIERNNDLQSPQYTDVDDKLYSIWYDVFVDTVDIHDRGKSFNKYGSVTFKIDLDILLSGNCGKIWITKSNPSKWSRKKASSERWFESKEELEEDFIFGEFDQMILFRHCGGELDIKKYLKRVILDDPKSVWATKTLGDVDVFSMAYGVLLHAMTQGKLDVPIQKRDCPDRCKCATEYDKNSKHLHKMFFPEVS